MTQPAAAKAKTGPKPRPPELRRSKDYLLALAPHEFDQLRKCSQLLGLSIADILRSSALAFCRKNLRKRRPRSTIES